VLFIFISFLQRGIIMNTCEEKAIIEILKKEVVPALGCTEPIAVALAAAKCKETLEEEIGELKVFVSPNLFKNGMGVGIPGTGMVGLPIAAALGACGGESKFGLEVLKYVKKSDIVSAKEMLKEERVTIEIKKHSNPLFVECSCISKNKKHQSKVIIQQEHSNISLIEKDQKTIFEKKEETPRAGEELNASILSFEKIVNFVEEVNIENIVFLREAVKLNRAIAEEGLKSNYGLNIGKTMLDEKNSNIFSAKCDATYAIALTAAAADARMSGCILPAMSNSGSGNQGIAATVPLVAYAERENISEEKMLRSIALSHLLTIHIKSHLGRLSALCGIVAASTGASAALCYLMGGNKRQIEMSINNMIANLTGMICDGAKPGCALKVASGVNAAFLSASLALGMNGATQYDGIVDNDVEKTMKNLANIGAEAMKMTDEYILNIMVCK
jgi:L-cysteine desulfidase